MDIPNNMHGLQSSANYAAVAAASRKAKQERIYAHLRPRSLFVRGSEDIDFDTIYDELTTSPTTKEYAECIEALYEIRNGIWIATFLERENGEAIRDKIHNKIRKNPDHDHFNAFTIELPRLPATHLIIRGVPAKPHWIPWKIR